MSEALIYRRMQRILIPYFILYALLTLIYYFYFRTFKREYVILVSLLVTLATIYMISSFLASSKIKGTDRTYVVGPDLAILEEVDIEEKKDVEEAKCAQCGKFVYKPFTCPDCKKLYCGAHYLQGEHDCIPKH